MRSSRQERSGARRRETREALRRSESCRSAILDISLDAIISIDHEGRIIEFNPAAEALFGYGRDQALGRSMADLIIPPSLRDRHRQGLLNHLKTGETRVLGRRIEISAMRADGSEIPVELAITRVPGAQPPVFTGFVRDLGERRRVEEALRAKEAELRQSQKMEAIGRLAGGVAHDFNNLLTVITGHCDLILSRIAGDDPTRGAISVIRETGRRAAGLTRQLLAFSRKQVLQTSLLDLNEIVRGVEGMLRRLIGEDVDLAIVLCPERHRVKADPGQLEQVIMNLVVNARDAMPRGGRLSIETAVVELDGAYQALHPPVTPGTYMMLAVSDTGIGMDRDTQGRIFEPFFTTKGEGKGTGLGLATVYGILKQSGGYVWVYSEPGRGTTFKIYLPLVQEAGRSEALAQFQAASAGATGGSETLLVVEDEETLRGLVREILQRDGYKVLEAADADAARHLCAAYPGAIDLMVTDVILPRMSGRELAGAVAPLRPGMRVLYMSGYTNDAVVRHGVLERKMAFLQKPFTAGALGRKVREVLDAAPLDAGLAPAA